MNTDTYTICGIDLCVFSPQTQNSQILLIYYFSIYEVRFNAQIVDSKLSNRKIKYNFV